MTGRSPFGVLIIMHNLIWVGLHRHSHFVEIHWAVHFECVHFSVVYNFFLYFNHKFKIVCSAT